MNLTSRFQSTHAISRDLVQLSNRKPVNFHLLIGQGECPLHHHEFHEICLVAEGSAEHRVEGCSRPLSKGSVMIMAPGQVHGIYHSHKLVGTNIYYLAEWLLADPIVLTERTLTWLFLGPSLFASAREGPGLQFEASSPLLDLLVADLREIEAEYRSPASSIFVVRLIFLRFLHRLAREYERQQGLPLDGFRPEVWHAVHCIERLVRENRPFDAGTLAREAGCSAGHLHRLFRAATGIAPMAYFQRRRMQHAGHLLLESDLSVTEIAYRVNCADSAHLSRCFRKQMGVTPRDYRKRFSRDWKAIA